MPYSQLIDADTQHRRMLRSNRCVQVIANVARFIVVEETFGWLAWFLVEIMLIYTGKFVVTVVSFGQWRGENLCENEGRTYSAAGSLSFKRGGQRLITVNGLLFAGVFFYVALAITFFFWASQS